MAFPTPGSSFVVGNLNGQAVPATLGVVADEDPTPVAQGGDLGAGAGVRQVAVGDRRPRLAAISGFTLVEPFWGRAIIAHQCVERAVLAADNAGLDVPAGDQGGAGLPRLPPIVRDGHQG